MIKEIITDETLLSYRSDEIDVRKENQEMRDIIICLKDAIRELNLNGLSAPQIGYNKRIIVLNFNGDLRTFINPIITDTEGFEIVREKCISLNNCEYIRPRSSSVTITYQTPLGKIESRKLIGLAATVFQHQLDHLDGLLLSDIGIEVGEDFDNASEEEKAEFIKMYLDSLDIKEKEVKEDIAKDEELQKTMEAITFLEKVQKGEVTLSQEKEVRAISKPEGEDSNDNSSI